MSFDIFEKLLNQGLEHVVEDILVFLPLEDVLCRVVLVNRYVCKIDPDDEERQCDVDHGFHDEASSDEFLDCGEKSLINWMVIGSHEEDHYSGEIPN